MNRFDTTRREHPSLCKIATGIALAFGLAIGAHGGTGTGTLGYTWKDSFESDGPVYEWINIRQTGTEVLGYGDSSKSVAVDLEVPTFFYEDEHIVSQVAVSENGYISNDPTDNGSDSTNDCGLPAATSNGAEDDRIYVLHDDIDFAPPITGNLGRGRILYDYLPRSPHPENGCGVQVFTWLNMVHDGGTKRFDFQVLLFDNFDILMQFAPGNPENGSGSTTGLNSVRQGRFALEGDGLEIACDTANSIPDNYAVLIEPPAIVVDDVADLASSSTSTTLREAGPNHHYHRKIKFDPSLDGATISYNTSQNYGSFNFTNQSLDASDLPNGITIDFAGLDPILVAEGRMHIGNITLKNSSGPALTAAQFTTVYDCQFRDNQASDGAAIMLSNDTDTDVLKVADTKFIGNDATRDGGAIHIGVPADVGLAGCRFTSNEALTGGAIFFNHADANVTCETGVFLRNESGAEGAAVAGIFGTFAAYDTSFTSNTTAVAAAVSNVDGVIDLERCTFDSNDAMAALRVDGADASLNSSTVSGTVNGNGVNVIGGGDMDIDHSTIAENSGFGIEVLVGSSVDVGHTIFAGNQNPVRSMGGTVNSTGFNLLDADEPAFDASTNDIENTDALLTPLASNGGLTKTHAPNPASPAIDGGSLLPSFGPDTDQRGFERIVDGDGNGNARIDIGSYEFVGAITVTTADDELLDPGMGVSLREAIDQAGGGGVIQFDPALNGSTIELAIADGGQGTRLKIEQSITIDTSNLADGLKISGGDAIGVMEIDGASVSLLGIDIIEGNSRKDGGGLRVLNGAAASLIACAVRRCTAEDHHGGGIYVGSGSTLDLIRCKVSSNATTTSNVLIVAHGGGVHVDTDGTLEARDCTFAGNIAGSSGGAIYCAAESFLELQSSTISGNEAVSGGGMLLGTQGSYFLENATISGNIAITEAGGLKLSGPTTLEHCTIVGNHADGSFPGGVVTGFADSTATHTIIAGNRGGSGLDNLSETGAHDLVSLGHNLIDQAEIAAPHTTDLIGFKPHLAPLGFYGGDTQTHPPLAISPAIDAGDDSLATPPATDARGYARVVAGTGDPLATTIDIGAVEAGAPIVVNTAVDEFVVSAQTSLREALSQVEDGGRILFDPILDGATIDLSTQGGGIGTGLRIDDSVEIDATSLPRGISISGRNRLRPLEIQADNSVALHAVSIRNGRSHGDGGAVISRGKLTISHAAIIGSYASLDGGGIAAREGSLRLFNCTLSGNTAEIEGGAIALSSGVTASLQHCTVANNHSNDATATGGIALGVATMRSYSSIFADNTNASGPDNSSATGSIPDRVESLGYNMSDINLSATFDATGDQPGVSPALAALADNGGWSATHATTLGSPANGAGDPKISLLHAFDARGFLRVGHAGPEIGAHEYLGAIADGDLDGIKDFWELLHGFDPTDPSDATQDPDGDGDDNLTEFQNGTDPREAPFTLPLEILALALSPDGMSADITFRTEPGLNYGISHSTDLQNWALLFTVTGFAGGDVTAVGIDFATHGIDPGAKRGFFRIDRQ